MSVKIAELMRAAKKTNYTWTRGSPTPQPWFTYSAGKAWHAVEPNQDGSKSNLSSLSVLSWNIDQFRAFQDERMMSALNFLQRYIAYLPRQPVIMLNEMLVSDLGIIKLQSWVRDGYFMTDESHTFWESSRYGTCVLIPKVMSISQIFRVHYEGTYQERDALCIDLRAADNQILRICSSHLESLVAEPPLRPSQVATAAEWLHEADAGILGGDLNAIQPFDRTLHSENNLKDAYLQLGGKEDDEAGMTWGQMAATWERMRFGLTRMDKFFFCGNVEVDHFETFGIDVVVEDDEIAKLMVDNGGIEKAWVTDHLGIRADFHLKPKSTQESSNL